MPRGRLSAFARVCTVMHVETTFRVVVHVARPFGKNPRLLNNTELLRLGPALIPCSPIPSETLDEWWMIVNKQGDEKRSRTNPGTPREVTPALMSVGVGSNLEKKRRANRDHNTQHFRRGPEQNNTRKNKWCCINVELVSVGNWVQHPC